MTDIILKRHATNVNRSNDLCVELVRFLVSRVVLRAKLLGLASEVAERGKAAGILVIRDPRLQPTSIKQEWDSIIGLLRPEIAALLSVVVENHGRELWRGGYAITPEVWSEIQQMLAYSPEVEPSRPRQPPRGSAEKQVLLVLVDQFLRHEEPLQVTELQQIVGTSYLTVRRALDQLAHTVSTTSSRSVFLEEFPLRAWNRMLESRVDPRRTTLFVDRSGKPRSPRALLDRFVARAPRGVAISGVEGARFYDAALDLIGLPRLDIVLHAPDGRADLSFIEELDPGLAKSQEPGAPAGVAVHLAMRADPGFTMRASGPPIASRVDCLLDLQSLHLMAQAEEFVTHCRRNRETQHG